MGEDDDHEIEEKDMSEEYANLSESQPGDSYRIEKEPTKPQPRQAQKNNKKVQDMPIVKNLDLGKITGMNVDMDEEIML